MSFWDHLIDLLLRGNAKVHMLFCEDDEDGSLQDSLLIRNGDMANRRANDFDEVLMTDDERVGSPFIFRDVDEAVRVILRSFRTVSTSPTSENAFSF